ncbi:unnamed protein product [Cuscuta epithymum]|uniref:Uncharacterized protein n=2 Tax=Cuscuta epithymum TaxID=186058 RepID=A0AAV0C7G6_9ASTE|nr:unnamed protein product [Cuscuta epithymum]CAH9134925.1 unnamed protein product [Cuscuta epithymum]
MTDNIPPGNLQDKVEGTREKGTTESEHEIDAMNDQKAHQDAGEGNKKISKTDSKGERDIIKNLVQRGGAGEVNMEAEITPDDVMRAGGLGARDDIGSFLPTAIDTTDFEASLLDAREYEEPQERICRPGLGWTDTTNDNK